jgi:hypothetical protein
LSGDTSSRPGASALLPPPAVCGRLPALAAAARVAAAARAAASERFVLWLLTIRRLLLVAAPLPAVRGLLAVCPPHTGCSTAAPAPAARGCVRAGGLVAAAPRAPGAPWAAPLSPLGCAGHPPLAAGRVGAGGGGCCVPGAASGRGSLSLLCCHCPAPGGSSGPWRGRGPALVLDCMRPLSEAGPNSRHLSTRRGWVCACACSLSPDL